MIGRAHVIIFCILLARGGANHDKLYFHPKKRERARTGHRVNKIAGSYFDPCVHTFFFIRIEFTRRDYKNTKAEICSKYFPKSGKYYLWGMKVHARKSILNTSMGVEVVEDFPKLGLNIRISQAQKNIMSYL